MRLVVAAVSLALLAADPAAASARDEAVKAYLRQELRTELASGLEREGPTRVTISWLDLNSDGRPEAIVLLEGRGWCGTGGCHLLVLERSGASFRDRGRLGTVRAPVGALRPEKNGWRPLSVWCVGGGDLYGRLMAFRFDGKAYAEIRRPVSQGAWSEVLIPTNDPGEALSPARRSK